MEAHAHGSALCPMDIVQTDRTSYQTTEIPQTPSFTSQPRFCWSPISVVNVKSPSPVSSLPPLSSFPRFSPSDSSFSYGFPEDSSFFADWEGPPPTPGRHIDVPKTPGWHLDADRDTSLVRSSIQSDSQSEWNPVKSCAYECFASQEFDEFDDVGPIEIWSTGEEEEMADHLVPLTPTYLCPTSSDVQLEHRRSSADAVPIHMGDTPEQDRFLPIVLSRVGTDDFVVKSPVVVPSSNHSNTVDHCPEKAPIGSGSELPKQPRRESIKSTSMISTDISDQITPLEESSHLDNSQVMTSTPPDSNTGNDTEAFSDEQSACVVVKYREGDVVYAKMRGYPYWPAIVEAPPIDALPVSGKIADVGSYFTR